MATIDGSPAFGVAVTVTYTPNGNVQQMNEFFGINGTQTIFGGTRGAVLEVSGVLAAADIPTLNSAESSLLSYADGNAHTVVDDRGRTFPNVVWDATYQPSAAGIQAAAGGGWLLPYKAVMKVVA
jgi:hypothetical protein